MKRFVGSTLAAETQLLLDALGHSEWLVARLAEAFFYDMDI